MVSDVKQSIMDDTNLGQALVSDVGLSLNPFGKNFAEAQLDEIEEGMVLSEKMPPMKNGGFYVVLFALMNLNDGLMFGYNNGLVALFTEEKVPSSERALLYMFALTTVLRMFVAPITDKYFVKSIGKRKTYLFPTKIINTILFFSISFCIDDLVAEKKVLRIAFFFLGLSVIMLFENNAIIGMRFDFFGPQRSNLAGAAAAISGILGVTFGLQIFTSLNSKKICTKYLGLEDALLDHKKFFMIVGVINVVGLVIIACIKEKDASANSQAVDFAASSNPVRVIKALFSVERLRTIILWNFAGPSFPIAIMIVTTQYYIQKGVSREFYTLFYGVLMIPFTIISNTIWVSIVKRGRLAFLVFIGVVIATIAELFHVVNHQLFIKGENETMTYLRLAAIQLVATLGNWNMVQISLFVRAAPKKYAITFISTVNSMFSASRIPPVFLATYFVDQLSFAALGGIILVLLGCLCVTTYGTIVEVSQEDPNALGEQFCVQLEANK